MTQVIAPFKTKNYAAFKALERKQEWSPSPETIAAIRRDARTSDVRTLLGKYSYPCTEGAFRQWLKRMNIITPRMRSRTDVEYGR